MKKKYEKLKDIYPEYISPSQLGTICGINKRGALYLIQNRIIPAIDTKKKTRRYMIAINDVITYLRRREHLGTMIPSRASSSCVPCVRKLSFSSLVGDGSESEIRRYFELLYASADDVLTAPEVAKMTGLHHETILDLLRSGKLKSISSSPHYIIPKVFLFEFVTSAYYISLKSKSQAFIDVYNGFAVWKVTNELIVSQIA